MIDNVNLQSLRHATQPQIFMISPVIFNKLTISFRDGYDFASSIENIQNVWQRYTPERPFVYEFLDEKIRKTYSDTQTQTSLLTISALVAVLLAGIGLFVMSFFVSALRSQEVVIRRVFGASKLSLGLMLINEFSRPFLVAVTVSIPIGYYIAQSYLSQFSYRVEVSNLVFIGVSFSILLIAWGAVAVNILRVLKLSPAHVLHHD